MFCSLPQSAPTRVEDGVRKSQQESERKGLGPFAALPCASHIYNLGLYGAYLSLRFSHLLLKTKFFSFEKIDSQWSKIPKSSSRLHFVTVSQSRGDGFNFNRARHAN